MIVLNLSCDKLHRFEGWFASGDDFAVQHTRGMVTCPVCGSHSITKLPSSPRVKRSRGQSGAPDDKTAGQQVSSADRGEVLMMLVDHLIASSEDVGERFVEEARRIHYDEAPSRSIRGVASAEETQSLLDEGIIVISLPVPPKGEVH